MKIDLNQIMRDPKGQPFTQTTSTVKGILDELAAISQVAGQTAADALALLMNTHGQSTQPLTLSDVLYIVASSCPKTNKGTPDERRTLGRAAQKVAKGGEVDLDEKEVELLKEGAGEHLVSVLLVAVEDALAPK